MLWKTCCRFCTGSRTWQKTSEDAELESGHHFLSESEVQLDGETGFCFTFTDNEHSDHRWVHFVFPIHRLSVSSVEFNYPKYQGKQVISVKS